MRFGLTTHPILNKYMRKLSANIDVFELSSKFSRCFFSKPLIFNYSLTEQTILVKSEFNKQVQYFCYCSVLHNIIIEYIRLIENGNSIFCGNLRIGNFHKIEDAYVERQVFREVGA